MEIVLGALLLGAILLIFNDTIISKSLLKSIYLYCETEQYEVYFSDGEKYYGITKAYKYDSKQKCLIKITEQKVKG